MSRGEILADVPAAKDEGAAEPDTRTARARAAADRLSRRLEPTLLGRLWSRLLEVEFVDRAVALAAKAFVCFFPLLIIVTALSPQSIRADVLNSLTNRFGISGEPFEVVRQAFATADQTRTASGITGVVITVIFGVAFTSALQRTYLRAWRRPPGGGAWNKGRGAMWVAGVIALLMVLTLARRTIDDPIGDVLVWAAGLVGAVGLWWWTARLMTRAEVRWRALLPTAVLTGVGPVGLHAGGDAVDAQDLARAVRPVRGVRGRTGLRHLVHRCRIPDRVRGRARAVARRRVRPVRRLAPRRPGRRTRAVRRGGLARPAPADPAVGRIRARRAWRRRRIRRDALSRWRLRHAGPHEAHDGQDPGLT